MKIANWYEYCKLIWKLQSNSHFLVYGSYVDICNFHKRDTAGLKTCSGKEFLGWVAAWTTKLIGNNLSQNLPRLIFYTNSCELPPRRIPTVGIVWNSPSTPPHQSHKHHHHGGAVCPSYGVVSMDTPDRTWVTYSKLVRRACRRGLYKSIK
jgi:hypothetical protein